MRFTASVFLAAIGLVSAQCPNNLAVYNPNLRTMTANSTWFVLPVPKAAVQKAVEEAYPFAGLLPVNKLSLLPVPAEYNIPEGFHPILVSSAFQADIRMAVFQIDEALMSGAVVAPFVGKGSSATPLAANLPNYIGGSDDQTLKLLAALVPNAVSTLVEGTPVRLGKIEPGNAAYQENLPGLFSTEVKWVIVLNDLTGPGVYVESHDFTFVNSKESKFTLKQFKALINQPVLLNGPILTGQCIRNTQYLDSNSTGVPIFQTGNVTLGPGSSGTGSLQKASPDGVGNYFGVHGVSSCAQVLGSNPENCDQSAKNVDPAAL